MSSRKSGDYLKQKIGLCQTLPRATNFVPSDKAESGSQFPTSRNSPALKNFYLRFAANNLFLINQNKFWLLRKNILFSENFITLPQAQKYENREKCPLIT